LDERVSAKQKSPAGMSSPGGEETGEGERKNQSFFQKPLRPDPS